MYLHFQIKWLYSIATISLLPTSELSSLTLLPQDPAAEKVVELHSLLHQLWLQAKQK